MLAFFRDLWYTYTGSIDRLPVYASEMQYTYKGLRLLIYASIVKRI